MARSWTYVFAEDQLDQDADHIQVEYRPGGGINVVVRDGATGVAVEVVGMPYARFVEMAEAIGAYHDAEAGEFSFAIDTTPLDPSTRAMLSAATGGVRAVEVRAQFEDEPGPTRRTPEDWCREYSLAVADPDGWRGEYALSWDEPIALPDFWWRYGLSTALAMLDDVTSARIVAALKLAGEQVAGDD